jgi:hypothetical protein
VVVDSSSPENYARLENQVGEKAKLYNLPPLGYADPFHKLGANLAEHDWILHIDDDEVPSRKLLENLKTEDHVAAYRIKRLEKERDFISEHPRLYNRKRMHFTGLVHFSLIPRGEIKSLSGVLVHNENPSSQKWKRYAVLDAYAIGFKAHWRAKNKKWHPSDNTTPW